MRRVARLAYNLLLHLALPLVLLRLWWRGRREPGYRADRGQRFGFYQPAPATHPAAATATPASVGLEAEGLASVALGTESLATEALATEAMPLIWLHAVSLGETLAARPLVQALRERYPGHRLLITHMTATGRAAALREYGAIAQLAWLPYDLPWAMQRFFVHFAPALGVVMETEVWPNLSHCAQAHGVPMLLANARLSARSERGYRRVRPLVQAAFAGFDACAQTAADGARLSALGARTISITGNLKFDTAMASVPPAALASLRALTGTRPVFLAASTREGEEALLLDALARHPLACQALGNVLTVIVPRHPQRFDEVAALLEQRRLGFCRRSAASVLAADCAVLLGDSMGEMPLYYALADCAFIGGSLVPVGGQNMIEAAALGVPTLYGPHTYNFTEAAEQAVAAGAALRVSDADDALRTAKDLLADPARRALMREAGRAFCATHRGATARTMKVVAGLLGGSARGSARRR